MKLYILFKICIFFLFPLIVNGAENRIILESPKALEESSVDEVDDLVEIDGLIIDRTLTRLGKDFYFSFSIKMNSKHNDLDVNLTVKERPTALSGSIIGVYHFDKVIYRGALSPGQRQAEEKAEQAIEAVDRYIVRWQTEKLFKDTYDLDFPEI